MSPLAFEIRPATPGDLDAILALEQATDYAPHWSRQTYLDILQPSNLPHAAPHHTTGLSRTILIAVPQSDAGVTSGSPSLFGVAVSSAPCALRGSAPRPAELESLAVAAAARRQGIGRALCRSVTAWARIQHATALELEVRASSEPAIALYRGLGFRETGRRPRYYDHPPDDALLLHLAL
jgi:ribosomal-protein-alanine N-acetyltransferase